MGKRASGGLAGGVLEPDEPDEVAPPLPVAPDIASPTVRSRSYLSYSADLYSACAFSESLVKANEWFVLEFIAEGPRLIVKVNGRETANLEHAQFQKGHIVLQARSDDRARINTVVEFRKIEVKELGD